MLNTAGWIRIKSVAGFGELTLKQVILHLVNISANAGYMTTLWDG